MYHGGIKVLMDTSNPERIVHCAHSMRELMEKLPTYIGLPAALGRLRSTANAFQSARMQQKQLEESPTGSSGGDLDLDKQLDRLLEELEGVFEELNTNWLRSQGQIGQSLGQSGSVQQTWPKALATGKIADWGALRQYFTKISHHGSFNKENFPGRLDALERILLDMLRPRTFEDFDEIDSLLGEEGQHA